MHTTRVKAQKNRAAITIAVYTHMNRCREQGAEVLRQLEADEQLLTECSRLLSKEQGKCQPFWLDNQKNRPAEQESCCLEVIRCPRAVPSTHCLSHHSQMSFLILNKQPHSTSFLRILMPLAGVQMAQDSVNFFHLKHHARTKALFFHHLTMLSPSTAILHQRPLMRAFLFFQKRKTKLRTGKTASQYQLQSMLDAEGWRGHWQAVPWFSSHTLISAP